MEYFSFEFTVRADDVDIFEDSLFTNGCRDAYVQQELHDAGLHFGLCAGWEIAAAC